jgi:hypothetical protein
MAVRTISQSNLTPHDFYRPAWAGALEGALTGGIGVANQYLDKRNAVKKWTDLGFPDDAAQAISLLPPDAQAQIIERYLKDPRQVIEDSKRVGIARSQQREQMPLNEAPSQSSALQAALQQQAPGQVLPMQSAPQAIPLQELAALQQAQGNAPQIQGIEQAKQQSPSPLELLSAAAHGRGVNVEQPIPQQNVTRELQRLNAQQPNAAPGTESALEGLQNAIAGSPQSIMAPQTAAPKAQPEPRKNAFEGITNPRTANAGAEDLARRKQDLAERAEEREINKEDQKRANDYYNTLEKRTTENEKTERRDEQLRRLIDKGDLPTPEEYNKMLALPSVAQGQAMGTSLGATIGGGLGLIGGPLAAGIGAGVAGTIGGGLGAIWGYMTPGERASFRKKYPGMAQFEKIVGEMEQDFMAKTKGQTTEAKLESFRSSIPNLSLPNDEKIAVLDHRAFERKIENDEFKIARIVRKNNGGKFPNDYAEVVQQWYTPVREQQEAAFQEQQNEILERRIKEKNEIGGGASAAKVAQGPATVQQSAQSSRRQLQGRSLLET